MKRIALSIAVLFLVVLFCASVQAKSCKNHECGECGHEECVECPDCVCPDIPDCICNGTECPDITCPEIPPCPPDPDCNCPDIPDITCPSNGECPDCVCSEIPDCICNNSNECPDCICDEKEDGRVSVYNMFGIAGGTFEPRVVLGTLSIYKDQKIGFAVQCLITGDLIGGKCGAYFLVESN